MPDSASRHDAATVAFAPLKRETRAPEISRTAPLASDVAEKSLVGQSSILILSGFLIGIAAGRVAPPGMELPVLAAGALGLAAYLVAGLSAAKRRRRAAISARDQAVSDLETRVERHVTREFGPDSALRRRRDLEHQYLTVVTFQRENARR